MRCRTADLRAFSVMIFGNGRLPEMLLTCMQYRLVVELAAVGRASETHLVQLRRHLRLSRCRACEAHLVGRLEERRHSFRRRRGLDQSDQPD